jgi:hypothetical protein
MRPAVLLVLARTMGRAAAEMEPSALVKLVDVVGRGLEDLHELAAKEEASSAQEGSLFDVLAKDVASVADRLEALEASLPSAVRR